MWRRKQREADLDRELRSHLEAEVDEQGDLYAARRALGNLGRVKEDVREAWGWTWLERLEQDLRYALRTMRQSPGFTATAVLSLALGIGANTAIFSLIDALMLRWLPGVNRPQELVFLQMRPGGATLPTEAFSYPIVRALADQKDIFAGVCGFFGASFAVGPPESASQVSGVWVTGDYYETLAVNPLAGRLLARQDDEPGAPLVGIISDGYWERQFARNPAIIGQTVPVNGAPVTIVGVSPPGFVGAIVGRVADLTLPVAAMRQVEPARAGLLGPGNFWLQILARPREVLSRAQVKSRIEAVWPQLAERAIRSDWPAARKKSMAEASFLMTSGATGYTRLRQMFRTPLLVLMAVVALVLFIACANVASLLLARATAREREIAVRLATGASRRRIVRQLLTESLLLSALGAGLGIGLSWFASRFLLDAFTSGVFTVALDLTPNWHVLTFTAAVAVSSGVLFGLAPALHSASSAASLNLKENSGVARSRSRLLSSIMSVQVAISLVLVIGAGLFLRTFQNLQNLDLGFRREGILLLSGDAQRQGYQGPRLLAFYNELADRIRQIPGVVLVTLSNNTPLSGGTWTEKAVPVGLPLPENDNAIFISVGPRYFETMQTPLLLGREFDSHDDGKPSVAIVNEAYAQRYFRGRNPLGQHVLASLRPASELEIVGVVKNTLTEGLRRSPYPTVYIAYLQREAENASLVIRVAGSFHQVFEAARKEIRAKLPDSTINIRGLTEQVDASLVQERAMAKLASAFGSLALVLACVGLYGMVAYNVVRRTREIGIRMALGARRSRLIVMVLKGALRLLVIGIALGTLAAWTVSRWVESMLFGLTPTDPATILGAASVLATAALLAAYLPALRASRVDPMTALRHE